MLDAMLAALLGFMWYIFVQNMGLLFVFGAGFCQKWYLTGSWIDFYMLVNAPDFGAGKEKGLKLSFFILEVVKRSPFQVGIEAVPQLGSCFNVGISAAAQVPVVAAAFKECCVSVVVEGVSFLYNVPLTLVFKCVALAAAAWDLVAAAFTAAAACGAFCDTFTLVNLRIVLVGDFLFAVAGLFPVTQQQAAAAGGHYASEAKATPRVDVGDPPEASSFHQAMGSHDTKGEESTKVQKFQVFVKNLAGKTVVVRGFTGMDEVSLVVSQVELLTGVPCSLFYLVGASGRCHCRAEWDWARLLSVHDCAACGRVHETTSPTCAGLLDMQ